MCPTYSRSKSRCISSGYLWSEPTGVKKAKKYVVISRSQWTMIHLKYLPWGKLYWIIFQYILMKKLRGNSLFPSVLHEEEFCMFFFEFRYCVVRLFKQTTKKKCIKTNVKRKKKFFFNLHNYYFNHCWLQYHATQHTPSPHKVFPRKTILAVFFETLELPPDYRMHPTINKTYLRKFIFDEYDRDAESCFSSRNDIE